MQHIADMHIASSVERLDPAQAKQMPGFMLKTPDAAHPPPEAVRYEIPAMGNLADE